MLALPILYLLVSSPSVGLESANTPASEEEAEYSLSVGVESKNPHFLPNPKILKILKILMKIELEFLLVVLQ